MQIGAGATGVVADRLQILQDGRRQPQVGQITGEPEGSVEGEQLLAGLGR